MVRYDGMMDDMMVIMEMCLARFMMGEYLLNVVAVYPSKKSSLVLSPSTENGRRAVLLHMGTVRCAVSHMIGAHGAG